MRSRRSSVHGLTHPPRRALPLAAVLGALLFSTGFPNSAAAADGVIEIAPGESIQAVVDARPAGTTYLIKAGTHRRQQVTPKDGDTFLGEPGAILTGEDSTAYAFSGTAVRVTIRGLIIEHYDSPLSEAPITCRSAGYWIVEDNEIRFNSHEGLQAGPRFVVRGNFIHHNGQLGIEGAGEDILIEANEIAFNNTGGFDPYWEAGGTKFVFTINLVVRDNYVHDNSGPGLWTDINNVNTLYERNRVTDNFGPGIFHEISYNATIRANTVEGNGFGYTGWVDGAGILVNSSPNVEIYDNAVRYNNDGIAGIQADRGSGTQGPWVLKNLSVHHNTIAMATGQTGIVRMGGLSDPVWGADWNNRFDYNTYTLNAGDEYYTWDPWTVSRAGWRAAGQDAHGTWTDEVPAVTTTTTPAGVDAANSTSATTAPSATGNATPNLLTSAALEPAPPAPSCGGRPATVVGTEGPDRLTGTAGADVIVGLGGDDTIYGAGGHDLICGGPGSDMLSGGAGDDRLYGDEGDDRLRGGPGRDLLVGGQGDDALEGNGERDALVGGKGRDSLHDGGDDDILLPDSGRGLLKGPGRLRLWRV